MCDFVPTRICHHHPDPRVQDTFLHVRDWLEEARKYAPPGFGTLLIGNKCDRADRSVSVQRGARLLQLRACALRCAPPHAARSTPPALCDVERRAVTTEEGAALAEELGMPFLETSARTAENVDAAFFRMAELLLKAR